MRLRFSLRTFFLLLTALGVGGYLWLTLPTQRAKSFANAINSEDFATADSMFEQTGDHFLADWAARRWAFAAGCEMRPLSLGQLLTARRHLDVHIRFFQFDSVAEQHVQVVATPFGLNAPTISTVRYEGKIIDTGHNFGTLIR